MPTQGTQPEIPPVYTIGTSSNSKEPLPPTGGSKPLDINSGKLSSQDSPTTPFSYSSRSKHKRKGIRGCDRINDGDTNGNNYVKRNKNHDIQRDIPKKYILICPPSLLKRSFDIRTPQNQEAGNFVVIMNRTLRNPSAMGEMGNERNHIDLT